jgi:hypothetical protein
LDNEPKPTKSRSLPGAFVDYALISSCDGSFTDELLHENSDLTTYIQAMNNPDAKKKWKAAINS